MGEATILVEDLLDRLEEDLYREDLMLPSLSFSHREATDSELYISMHDVWELIALQALHTGQAMSSKPGQAKVWKPNIITDY